MSKYPLSDDFTARVIRACQILKSLDKDYFAPVITDLMSREQKTRHKKRPPKVVEVNVANQYGTRARGGSKGYVDSALIERAAKEKER